MLANERTPSDNGPERDWEKDGTQPVTPPGKLSPLLLLLLLQSIAIPGTAFR